MSDHHLPLFRPETPDREEEEDRPKKRSKFFQQPQPPSDLDEDTEEEVEGPSPPKLQQQHHPKATTPILDLDDSDDDDLIIESPKKLDKGKGKAKARAREPGQPPAWESYPFGEAVISAYTLYRASAFCSLKNGEAISLHRDPPPQIVGKVKKKKVVDTVVRFKNSKGIEVGRVAGKEATWLSKLLDLNIISVTGHCILVEPRFQSGDTVTLSISPRLLSTAFTLSPHSIAPILPSNSNSNSNTNTTTSAKNPLNPELLESISEASLRERKSALNRLFDLANLEPVIPSRLLQRGGKKGGKSKRRVLEKYEKVESSGGGGKKKKNGGGKGKGSRAGTEDDDDDDDGEDEEAEDSEEIDKALVGKIFSKSSKHDMSLPEAEPASTFSLSLRPYQKQALGWMTKMEEGDPTAREEQSMHPLWEKYILPVVRGAGEMKGLTEEDKEFYYNPWSGELSLDFPKTAESTGSGILADEMGLGKTIMVASLIHTNTPFTSRTSAHNVIASADAKASSPSSPSPDVSESESDDNNSSESSDELYSEDSDGSTKPNKKKSKDRKKVYQTQSHLTGKNGTLSRSMKDPSSSLLRLKRGAPRATLVVAPMTLLSQWCSELERSAKDKEKMGVKMYYGGGRTDIKDEIESGDVKVVVTSYGTLCSDHRMSGLADEEGKEKKGGAGSKDKGKGKGKALVKKKMGLFGVEWFRVVLDEAHNIKSRVTNNAKACYALRADKRWCLTGTPIINRLEDLFSLLHFIKLEPWGNFSFFKAFITTPFEKKDPVALEFVQVILEGILLRREKSMKDLNGNPIVSLPKKHIKVEWLEFSKDERKIYDSIYKNAKSKFLGFANAGTVLKNVTAIFSILMRLRQAVLHPSLVLKRLAQNIREKIGDADEKDIMRLVELYLNNGGQYQPEVLKEILDGEGEVEEECPVCNDAIDTPTVIPGCLHSACKQCVLDAFEEAEERGEEPRCPVCNSGPIKESDILKIQRGDSQKMNKKIRAASSSPAKKKKVNYTSEASSSSQTEILTIIDSSDEDDAVIVEPTVASSNGKIANGPSSSAKSSSATKIRDKTPTPSIDVSSSPVVGFKGKGKAKVASDDEDDEDYEADAEDVKMGNVNDSSEDEDELDGESNGFGGDFQSSAKLNALVASLKNARKDDPKLKAVVFSQFTGFIDLIERVLNKERFPYVRLDGSMSLKAREKVLSKFNTTDKVCIFLASLKAGGVGLNLVKANHVYLMDIWWNEGTQNQAIDRIHRFGQTREVYVTHFLVRNSIDEKMLALCERKAKIVSGALQADKGKNSKALEEDFAAMFAD